MKISIIIPAYNCGEYLGDCLDSIINQTFKNYEIIIIDDGSTDNTGKICDEYAEKYCFISVIHQENQGVSYARNVGIKYITGDYVSFIDADDTLDKDMYEILADVANKYQVDIVHCGYKHIVGDEIRLVHDTGEIYVQNNEEALSCLIGGRLFVGSLWNKLYNVKLLENIKFDESLKINEDILFNFELFKKVYKSVFVDKAKYNYIARRGTSAVFITDDIKKGLDSTRVSRQIYNSLENGSLKSIARERYLRSLSGYYRVIYKNHKLSRRVAEEMWKVIKEGSGVGRSMKITTYLIYFAPKIYLSIYKIYNRLRKPNWEV